MNFFKQTRLLGLLVFVLFALISSGTTGSGDAMVRYRMARSLVARGDVSLDQPSSVTLTGRDGRIYAVYGIGQTLIFAMPEALVRAVCYASGVDCEKTFWEDVSVAISSVIVLPLISAAGIIFLGLALRELGFDQKTAVATAMLVACGSLILPYAKFHQEENQIIAITFASVYFAIRFFKRGRNRDAVMSAALCWLPMWFRVSAIAETIPLAVLIMALAFKRRDAKAWKPVLTTLLIAVAITGLWLMFYNWYRFGGVTNTGYLAIYERRGDLGANLLEGMAGPFLHPSKSLAIYSPLIALAVPGAFVAFRAYLGRALVLTAVAILLLSVIIPSGLRSWGGDTSWGPRYQIAGHAMLLIFVAYVWRRRREFSRAACVAVTAVAVWAIAVQSIGISFSYNLEYHRGLPHTWNQHTLSEWFATSQAQIPFRLDSLWRFRDAWMRSPEPPQDAVGEYSIPAFLPWKLGQRFGSRVWQITALIWVASWVGWGFYCRRFLSTVFEKDSDEAEESDAHE